MNLQELNTEDALTRWANRLQRIHGQVDNILLTSTDKEPMFHVEDGKIVAVRSSALALHGFLSYVGADDVQNLVSDEDPIGCRRIAQPDRFLFQCASPDVSGWREMGERALAVDGRAMDKPAQARRLAALIEAATDGMTSVEPVLAELRRLATVSPKINRAVA